MLVVGIHGREHSGKTTIAEHLVWSHGLYRIRFADKIKSMLVDGVGLEWSDVDDPVKKEQPHPRLNGQTPRQAMRSLGDWGRSISETFWVDLWMDSVRHVLELGKPIVCDDLRYPQELAALEKLGAVTMTVQRNGCDGPAEHSSESHSLRTDYWVSNNGRLAALYSQVDLILSDYLG